MTGMEGHRLGITHYREGYEIPIEDTLPRLLGKRGYQTRVVGKMHVYPERCHYGFDSMLLCEEGRMLNRTPGSPHRYDDYEQWLAEKGEAGQAFSHGIANNGYAVAAWPLPDHMHPTEWIGYETCKAIRNRDWTRPQFIWASFTAPHPPLTPPLGELALYGDVEATEQLFGDWTKEASAFHSVMLEQFRAMNERERDRQLAHRAYYALVSHMDRQINRIIGTLHEEGMLENTWFIVAADHGDCLGDHGLWGKAGFLRGSCGIPLIVAPPARALKEQLGEYWIPGRTSMALAGLQDILPTCVAIAGGAGLGDRDGIDLLPLVHQPDLVAREQLLGEYGVRGRRSFMLVRGHWKYLWYEQDGVELLFDMDGDPDELHNLLAEQALAATDMRERLTKLIQLRGEDPAIIQGQLTASEPGVRQTKAALARTVSALSPRGLHL